MTKNLDSSFYLPHAGRDDDPERVQGGDSLPLLVGPPLPKEPPEGLIWSMALRYDHALGCDGYYDQWGEGQHEARKRGTMATMRQLYEEVSGHGFFNWPNSRQSDR